MGGTQPGQNSTAAVSIITGLAAAGSRDPVHPPAQVLMYLMDRMMALLTVVVEPADKAQHDAEVAWLHGEVEQAKENLAAEDVRTAVIRLQRIYNFLLFHAIILSILDFYGLYYTCLYYFWD